MKKNLELLSFLVLLCFSAGAQTFTFSYTGALQTWTVPAGITSIAFDVKGASGGNSTYYSPGGCGGRVEGILAVTPGQVLNIYVGGMGGDGAYFSAGLGGTTGSSASGGNGGSWYPGGGGGGGGTDIRIGGTALTDRVVAAGGGGGGGDNCGGTENGGDGGGPGTAGDGWECSSYNSATCGAGGNPAFGGAAASTGFAGSGIVLRGGNGDAYYFQSGGGGGGGYYGGGGGYTGGGGGGSSYTDPALATSVVHTQGANCGSDGSVWICTVPTGGTVVGPTTVCVASSITYTNPTATPGGTWSSSAPLVASVNPLTGTLTMLTPGITTLTYSVTLPCGSASAPLLVNVISTSNPITGRLGVCPGDADTLFDATSGGTWGSSAGGVATIDALTGIISTVSPGTTTISYTVGACSATAIFTVNPFPAAIAGPSQVCHLLTVTLTDASAGGTWSSNVTGAVSIGSLSGIATGAGPGGSAAIISYTLPTGCVATRFISVTNSPLPITGAPEVCESNAIILTELVGGGVWTSSAPTTATVTGGVVTGLVPGTVVISYSITACPAATHTVTVNPLPAIITGPTAICVGHSTTLLDATTSGTWSSSDPSILVSPGGVVTSGVPGISGTIYYTLPTGCFVSTMVYVNLSPAPIIGADSICQGATTTFTISDTTGIWSSTDLSISRINFSTGEDTGISAGIVNISYTVPTGCYSLKAFKVLPPVPDAVSVSQSPGGIICEGTPMTFTAVPVYAGVATYQWKKFTSVLLGGIDSTGIKTYTPIHGDVFECVMYPHGVCALQDSVIDTFYANVYPNNVSPAITITTAGPDTVAFVGQIVTFYSNVIWGGPSPVYQWFRNGTVAPGISNGISYTTPVYKSDTFWCMITGNPPCMDTTPPLGVAYSNKIIIHDYLGIASSSSGNNDLTLFPNPNNGYFVLSGKLAATSDNEVHLEVSNMLGQVVYKSVTTPQNGNISTQIKLEGLPAGAYLLRVNTETGSETFHFVIGK